LNLRGKNLKLQFVAVQIVPVRDTEKHFQMMRSRCPSFHLKNLLCGQYLLSGGASVGLAREKENKKKEG
jgi:hypothetical protein